MPNVAVSEVTRDKINAIRENFEYESVDTFLSDAMEFIEEHADEFEEEFEEAEASEETEEE